MSRAQPPTTRVNHIIPPSSALCQDPGATATNAHWARSAAHHPAGWAPVACPDGEETSLQPPSPLRHALLAASHHKQHPACLIKNNDVLGLGRPGHRRFPGTE